MSKADLARNHVVRIVVEPAHSGLIEAWIPSNLPVKLCVSGSAPCMIVSQLLGFT